MHIIKLKSDKNNEFKWPFFLLFLCFVLIINSSMEQSYAEFYAYYECENDIHKVRSFSFFFILYLNLMIICLMLLKKL